MKLRLVACVTCIIMSLTVISQSADTAYQLYLTQIAAAEALLQLNKISEASNYLNSCDERYRDVEWHFLNAHLDQSHHTIRKDNRSAFNTVALSPDGRILAVACADSTIILYRKPELGIISVLRGHSSSVSTLTFSNDGTRLASGGRDHTVIIWDVMTLSPLVQNSSSFSQGIYQVRFHPEDRLLGVVSWEWSQDRGVMGFIKLLDTNDGSELKKIETEPHPAAGLVFSNNGMDVIVNTWGEIIYAYDVTTGEIKWKYDLSDADEYNAFHSVALSPDGSTLAAGSTDHRIHFIHATDGRLIRRIEPWEGHTKTIKALSFSEDGRWLASAGEDLTILIWNVHENTRRLALIGHTHTVTGLVWSDDGTQLFSTSQDGTLKRWNIENPFAKDYTICDFGPWQTPLTSDKKYFAAPCSDKNLAIYEIATGKERVNFGPHSGLCADISRDGNYLVTASFDGIVRLWDVHSGTELKTFIGHTGRVDGVAYMNTADVILSSGDTTLRVWSVKSGDQLTNIPLSHSGFRIVLHPDEQLVTVGSGSGSITTFNTSDWSIAYSAKCDGGLNEMTISPDGENLAIFSGKNIEVWNTTTGIHEYTLSGHEQGGYGIGFSPDGRYLVSGSYDQTFKLWNLEKKVCTLTYHGYQDVVYSCKFPTSRSLLIGTSQGAIWYYDFN